MKIKWQMTREEQKALRGMDVLKEAYARKVGEFIQALPEEFQRICYYEACDVVFEVVIALGRLNQIILEREREKND